MQYVRSKGPRLSKMTSSRRMHPLLTSAFRNDEESYGNAFVQQITFYEVGESRIEHALLMG